MRKKNRQEALGTRFKESGLRKLGELNFVDSRVPHSFSKRRVCRTDVLLADRWSKVMRKL